MPGKQYVLIKYSLNFLNDSIIWIAYAAYNASTREGVRKRLMSSRPVWAKQQVWD